MAEARRKIYVPQVVQVKWESTAWDLFKKPKVYAPDGTTSNLVYSADYVGEPDVLMQDTLQRLQAYYPASVNILFVPFFSTEVDTTKFLYMTSEIRKLSIDENGTELKVYAYGITSPTTLPSANLVLSDAGGYLSGVGARSGAFARIGRYDSFGRRGKYAQPRCRRPVQNDEY